MRDLMGATVAEVNAHKSEFVHVLDRIVESHTLGSGYMLVGASNKGAFREFLDWIDRLSPLVDTGPYSLRDRCADLDLDESLLPPKTKTGSREDSR